MSTPYIGFTNETLDKLPKLGPTAACPNCGKECEIKESKPPMLQFISCCGKNYLVGIRGTDISVKKPDVSGEVTLDETKKRSS